MLLICPVQIKNRLRTWVGFAIAHQRLHPPKDELCDQISSQGLRIPQFYLFFLKTGQHIYLFLCPRR